MEFVNNTYLLNFCKPRKLCSKYERVHRTKIEISS